jgi:hypothetical protein
MSGNRFLVKEDLKLSFIDRAGNLKHLHVRRGPDVAFWKSISRTGERRGGLWNYFKISNKEKLMNRKSAYKGTFCRLSHAVYTFGFLVLLSSLPAYGQQVHQLLYNNSYWADQNLNGAQSPIYSLAAFPTTPNDQTHVYFLTWQSGGGHVHQLFYNGVSWADEDLTVLSAGPDAGNGTVTGFSVGNYQYVYYVSADVPQHVHQLLYNNSRWIDSDLSVLGKAKVYAKNFGLVAFTTSSALHVYYKGGDSGDIHQLYSTNGTTWSDQDLTTLTAASQPLDLFSGFNIGNLQFVYYVDVNYDLHQLYYNNSSWSDIDISGSNKVPLNSGNCSLEAFVIPGTKKMRLYYCSYPKNHLVQLASNNGITWTTSDLTNKSNGPTPDNSGFPILAYATTPNDGIHVFYESGNHIQQIFQPTPTTWQHQDLTALGDDFGTPVDSSALAGFSLGNYQYVFYFAQ